MNMERERDALGSERDALGSDYRTSSRVTLWCSGDANMSDSV